MTDPYSPIGGVVIGRPAGAGTFDLPVTLPWFRALPLSSVEDVRVVVDGVVVPGGALTVVLDGVETTIAGLSASTHRYWEVGERLTLRVRHRAPAPEADLRLELVLRLPDGPIGGWGRRTCGGSAVLRTVATPATLGTCTFSLAGELRAGRSLRHCLDRIAGELPGRGIEVLGPQVLPGYPAPTGASLAALAEAVTGRGLQLVCYDAVLDTGARPDACWDDAALLRLAVGELDSAAALGCSLVRLNFPPRRELAERIAELADRRELAVLVELHAQTTDDRVVQELLGVLAALDSPALGLILDLSCVLRRLPAGFRAALTDLGADAALLDAIERAWAGGRPLDDDPAMAPAVRQLAQRAYRLFRRSGVDWLPDVLSRTRVVHAKFYDAGPSCADAAIPYPEVFATLARSGWTGPVMSEFEGHLWQQAPDTFGQLAAHQQVLAGLLAAPSGAGSPVAERS